MITVEQSRVLAPLTTMGVGGPADAYLECPSVDALRHGLALSRAGRIPVLILGGGSNVVVADEGFRGLVLRPLIRERVVRPAQRLGEAILRAGAGEPWDGLVQFAVEQGLAGLEALSGIPGLVGASPIQNIGAYGQEVSRIIESVDVLDLQSGVEATLGPEECSFAYRDSRFKSGPDTGRFVVLAVEFRLQRKTVAAAQYGELRQRLEQAGHDPLAAPLLAIRDAVLHLRRSKGMVVDQADPDSRSCGSFFTNPILPKADWAGLVQRWQDSGILAAGEQPPCYGAGEGLVKTSAAWLIERAGYSKGYALPTARPGTASLSTKHCLAITNRGGALAREILELATAIQQGVRERMGVSLTPEPVMIGMS